MCWLCCLCARFAHKQHSACQLDRYTSIEPVQQRKETRLSQKPTGFRHSARPPLRLVSALGQGWAPSSFTRFQIAASGRTLSLGQRPCKSDPAAAFVDDLTMVTMGVNALQYASALIWLVEATRNGQEFQSSTSLLAAIDYSSNRSACVLV